MPRGDWRKIQHFTHGPEKTKKAINGELVDPLQDALDRICALEDETDGGSEGLQPIELDVNGEIAIGYYRGTPPHVESDTDDES